jgi:hypothetical protein
MQMKTLVCTGTGTPVRPLAPRLPDSVVHPCLAKIEVGCKTQRKLDAQERLNCGSSVRNDMPIQEISSGLSLSNRPA